jgi:hypothetical protein
LGGREGRERELPSLPEVITPSLNFLKGRRRKRKRKRRRRSKMILRVSFNIFYGKDIQYWWNRVRFCCSSCGTTCKLIQNNNNYYYFYF